MLVFTERINEVWKTNIPFRFIFFLESEIYSTSTVLYSLSISCSKLMFVQTFPFVRKLWYFITDELHFHLEFSRRYLQYTYFDTCLFSSDLGQPLVCYAYPAQIEFVTKSLMSVKVALKYQYFCVTSWWGQGFDRSDLVVQHEIHWPGVFNKFFISSNVHFGFSSDVCFFSWFLDFQS